MYYTIIIKDLLENSKVNINVPIGKLANIQLSNSQKKYIYGHLTLKRCSFTGFSWIDY